MATVVAQSLADVNVIRATPRRIVLTATSLLLQWKCWTRRRKKKMTFTRAMFLVIMGAQHMGLVMVQPENVVAGKDSVASTVSLEAS